MNDDAFDLVPGAAVYALVVTPWTIHSSMAGRLGMAFLFQPFHEFLDFVGLRLVGNQDGVAGCDDDDIVEADDGGQMLLRSHEGVRGVDRHSSAAEAVAKSVLRAQS